MRFTWIIIFSAISVYQLIGQSISIQKMYKNSRSYPSLPTYYTLSLDGSCSDLQLKAENGLASWVDTCMFVVTPIELGNFSVFITNSTGDTLAFLEETICRWPKPIASCGIHAALSVPRGYFLASKGVFAPSSLGISGSHPILTFDYQVVREGELYFYGQQHGGAFSEETKRVFFNIKSGDVILFNKIFVQLPGEDFATELDPLRMSIE